MLSIFQHTIVVQNQYPFRFASARPCTGASKIYRCPTSSLLDSFVRTALSLLLLLFRFSTEGKLCNLRANYFLKEERAIFLSTPERLSLIFVFLQSLSQDASLCSRVAMIIFSGMATRATTRSISQFSSFSHRKIRTQWHLL